MTEEAPPAEAQPQEQRMGAEALPPERIKRARLAQRGYHRWLRLSRLTLGAFVVLALVFVAWLIPWMPSGLDSDDYTPEMAFTVYLLGGAAIIGLLALSFRELARRNHDSLLVWASVYDEVTGLHNRTYLYDRLSLECERAQRSGRPFSIIVLHIRTGGGTTDGAITPSFNDYQRLADMIDGLTHPTDVVALLSGSELAVLAFGVDRDHRPGLQERLRVAVQAALQEHAGSGSVVDVKAGAATYDRDADADDAPGLVQAARTAALLAVPQRTQAA